jgi:hypothetical protein
MTIKHFQDITFKGHKVTGVSEWTNDQATLLEGYCKTHNRFYYLSDGVTSGNCPDGLFSKLIEDMTETIIL